MAKARWTILTYIAAHNNLAMLGKVSLNQILGVGSTPEVVHGMLYDGPGEGGRYVVGDPGTVWSRTASRSSMAAIPTS